MAIINNWFIQLFQVRHLDWSGFHKLLHFVNNPPGYHFRNAIHDEKLWVDDKEPGIILNPASELFKKKHPSVQAGDEYQRSQNDPTNSSLTQIYNEKGFGCYDLEKNEIESTKPLKMKMDSPVNDPLIIDSR